MTPHKQPRRQSPAGPRGTGTEANRPSSKLRIHLADQRHEYHNKKTNVGTSPPRTKATTLLQKTPFRLLRPAAPDGRECLRREALLVQQQQPRYAGPPNPRRFKPTGGPDRLRKEQRCHKNHTFFCLEERLRGQRVHIYVTRASSGS